jgi:hypothetical protein
MNDESTMKCEFPASIEIKICEIFENAEVSIKSTLRGMMTDLRAESRNTSDLMHFRRESFLNEIDESDRKYEKHDEQRTSTFRGIVIDSRAESQNAYDSMHSNRESFSNEIDESDRQFAKHDEH